MRQQYSLGFAKTNTKKMRVMRTYLLFPNVHLGLIEGKYAHKKHSIIYFILLLIDSDNYVHFLFLGENLVSE